MKAADFGFPVERDIPIGSGVTITFVEHDGEIVGLNEAHQDKDGQPCFGFVKFRGAHPIDAVFDAAHGWAVDSANPLTLSPSILCKTCGNHGFIREGKWVPA